MAISAVLLCAAAVPAARAAESPPPAAENPTPAIAGNSAIQSTTDFVRRLIDMGYRRSLTFRHEVLALEGTDLVVLVEPASRMPPGITAYLSYVTTSRSSRVVRILFDMHRGPVQAIAIIGHELQHAIEVASHPEVVNAATLRAMYEKIGWRNHRSSQGEMFDSAEAIAAGRVILGELIASPAHETAATEDAGR